MPYATFSAYNIPPCFGQRNTRDAHSFLKQWRNIHIIEPCDTITDARHEETGVGMLLGILEKLIHVGLDGFHSSLHGGDGITPAGGTDTYSPFCTKLVHSRACCATAMIPLQIAAENEYLGT